MTIPQPPPLRPRRPLLRAGLIIGAFFLAGLVLLAALYLEENWRGARAWAACERELTAKGETLLWRSFVPPPIPDERNLAMAPLFVRAYQYQVDPKTHVYTFGPADKRSHEFDEMARDTGRPQNVAPGGWTLARPIDLPAYAQFFRGKPVFPHAPQPQSPAADVLLALTRYAPALDELARAAEQRPLSRFPVNWASDNPYMTALPHYNLEMQFARTLALRASARLAVGQPEDALHDLELGWRLCDDMHKDPVLIAHLVQITCLDLTLTPVWEGLANRGWTGAQLARLQVDLQRFDLLADTVSTFRGERTYDLHGIDFIANHRNLDEMLSIFKSPGDTSKPGFFWQWAYDTVPRGWFDLNKVVIARYMQTYLVEAIDPGARRVHLERLKAGTRARNALPFSFPSLLARVMLPLFDDSIPRRSARLQTGLDEAVTACALERFSLDRQTYPARLDELVPIYLPHVPTDLIDGAPLRYHATPDGRYQLYGIGWNARDDGGTVVWDFPRHLKDAEGDWVWQYTGLQPPAPAPKK